MLADLQISDSNLPDFDSYQLQSLGTQSLHHSPNLAVAPFGQGDLEEGEPSRIPHTRHHSRSSGTIVELDPLTQPVELLVV